MRRGAVRLHDLDFGQLLAPAARIVTSRSSYHALIFDSQRILELQLGRANPVR